MADPQMKIHGGRVQECREEFEKDRLHLLDGAEAAERVLRAELAAERTAAKRQVDALEQLVGCCYLGLAYCGPRRSAIPCLSNIPADNAQSSCVVGGKLDLVDS